MGSKKAKPKIKNKHDRDLEALIPQYIAVTGDQSWTTHDVAAWSIKKGLWEPPPSNAIRDLARALGRIARQASFPDENGNPVRKYHACRLGPNQPMLWEEMSNLEVPQWAECNAMRRNKMVAGGVQLTIDNNYFNKHYNPGDPVVFDPDLTQDIQDYFQPTIYDDLPPDDHEPAEEKPKG